MLERIDFDCIPIDRDEYKPARDELVKRLVLLQQEAHIRGIGLVVLFEGWDGAGKGGRISDLMYNLDARSTTVHVDDSQHEKDARKLHARGLSTDGYFPMMQPYWNSLGPRGNMTLYDRGWYNAAAAHLAEEITPSSKRKRIPGALTGPSPMERSLASIESFERQLVNDGYLVVKFFLHIRKKTQRKRLEGLAADPATAWRVDKQALAAIGDYDRYCKLYDKLLSRTNYDFAPWVVLNGEDKRRANLGVVRTLVDALDRAIAAADAPVGSFSVSDVSAGSTVSTGMPVDTSDSAGASENGSVSAGAPVGSTTSANSADVLEDAHTSMDSTEIGEELAWDTQDVAVRQEAEAQAAKQASFAPSTSRFPISNSHPTLKGVDYHLRFDPARYKTELKAEQKRLYRLELEMYKQRVPLILMYEGQDAAGKGGNIKRIAQALDARSYTIFPSPAPTKPELAHPFLWRYWTRLPKAGHVGIYDRSWYGRVLVERVEGFARPDEWARAYDEINEFERDLVDWGAILLKFWVEIDRDEQLRRFESRAEDPARQWKITDEDWRNRAKYPQYREAVEDMFRLTSTDFAPWIILESNDKRYARIKALRIINNALEERLKRR